MEIGFRFFKGNLNDLIVEEKVKSCIVILKKINNRYNWKFKSEDLKIYFKSKRIKYLDKILLQIDSNDYELIESTLRFYAYKFIPEKYDRIYVTTLFTFYWKITIKTIQLSKKLVKKDGNIFIGGVMASLLTDEIELETGIRPISGLLNKPEVLDKGNNLIIDELILDYSILDEIEYEYPTGSAYFTFMTKGCTRKCKFCSVPILEPVYNEKVYVTDNFEQIVRIYGKQKKSITNG